MSAGTITTSKGRNGDQQPTEVGDRPGSSVDSQVYGQEIRELDRVLNRPEFLVSAQARIGGATSRRGSIFDRPEDAYSEEKAIANRRVWNEPT